MTIAFKAHACSLAFKARPCRLKHWHIRTCRCIILKVNKSGALWTPMQYTTLVIFLNATFWLFYLAFLKWWSCKTKTATVPWSRSKICGNEYFFKLRRVSSHHLPPPPPPPTPTLLTCVLTPYLTKALCDQMPFLYLFRKNTFGNQTRPRSDFFSALVHLLSAMWV